MSNEISRFKPGNAVLIHISKGIGSGKVMLNKVVSVTYRKLVLEFPLEFDFSTSGTTKSQIIVMKQYSEVKVNKGVIFNSKKWNGQTGGILTFMCSGSLTICGVISSRN